MPNYFMQERPRSRLREIPPLPNPLAISQLNYSHNDIRSIPLHLTAALHLQILDLSHNKLAQLTHLQLLVDLRFTNFSHNLLSELPPSLAQLTRLQHLDVSHNRISIVGGVRVLKELVERRVGLGGGVEVCLEGNEVMKRKACRDTIRGWLQGGMQEESWEEKGSFERGSRRGAKSLELPCGRDSQLTQRTMLLRVKEIESVQLQRENNDSKMQATCQMSPSFQPSQELAHSPLPQTHSQLLPCGSDSLTPTQFSPIPTDLKEWFTSCQDRLTELTNNFALIATSADIASLPPSLKDNILEESEWAQQLVAASQQTLALSQQGTLSLQEENRFMTEISALNSKIRQSHRHVLKQFSENPQLPIRYYRPWVAQFRKLKEIMVVLPQRVAAQQQAIARQRQINELVSISPERPKGEWGRQGKEKLAELLFSKDRQEECLLLSGRASSEKQLPHRQQECENCLMGRWETTRQKQKIEQLQQKNTQLQQEKSALTTLVAQLQKFRDKYINISCKQELIIEELGELAPSTYQNILLEQAKTIEYMLQVEPIITRNQLAIEQEKTTHYTARQSNSEKEQQTRLTSGERPSEQIVAKISEFSLDDKRDEKRERNSIKQSHTIKDSIAGKDSTGRGSSYFKNKNIVTTVRTGEPLTQQECLSTEQNRIDQQRQRQEVVVSQFNSHANSLTDSDQKSKQKKVKEKTERSQENDVILISEGSDKKQSKSQTIKFAPRGQTNILQYIKSEEFNRLLGEKLTTGKPNREGREGREGRQGREEREAREDKENVQGISAKASKDISSFREGRERLSEWQVRTRNNSRQPPSNDRKRKDSKRSMPDTDKQKRLSKRSKTLQKDFSHEYVSHPYLPMASLEGDRYKKYVQYHLRNNIIEILSKKSQPVEETAALKKYHYLANSQKLICKEGLQPKPEVNKTFR